MAGSGDDVVEESYDDNGNDLIAGGSGVDQIMFGEDGGALVVDLADGYARGYGDVPAGGDRKRAGDGRR